MTVFSGAFSTDNNWAPHDLAHRLAGDARSSRDLVSNVLVEDTCLSCHLTEVKEEKSKLLMVTSDDGRSVIVIGDIADSRPESVLIADLAAQPERTLQNLNGRWLSIVYDRASHQLFLISDRLGTKWLYMAQIAKGFIFSNNFRALINHYPDTLHIDHDTALVMLGLQYAPDNRTCFQEISVLPPGGLLTIQRDGQITVNSPSISYGDRYASISVKEKFELLDDVLEKSLKDWCSRIHSGILLSLSDGYDSRYGLAMVQKMRLQAKCATFGNSRNKRIEIARGIAERSGLGSVLFNTQNKIEQKEIFWQEWEQSIGQLGGIAGFQSVCGWYDKWVKFLQLHGSHVFIGYLGDALSGKHLSAANESGGNNWIENWMRWSCEDGWEESPLILAGAKPKLRAQILVRLEEVYKNATFVFPHQKALHLDLYGRQRRMLAAQPNLISKLLTPVPFFDSSYEMEFWSNVPYEDLHDQSLYLSYGRSRFPQLFEEAPPRNAPSFLQRIIGSGINFAVNVRPGLKTLFFPQIIDRNQIIVNHRPFIQTLLKDVGQEFSYCLDIDQLQKEVEQFPHSSQVSAYQLLPLINLFMLIKLGMK